MPPVTDLRDEAARRYAVCCGRIRCVARHAQRPAVGLWPKTERPSFSSVAPTPQREDQTGRLPPAVLTVASEAMYSLPETSGCTDEARPGQATVDLQQGRLAMAAISIDEQVKMGFDQRQDLRTAFNWGRQLIKNKHSAPPLQGLGPRRKGMSTRGFT